MSDFIFGDLTDWVNSVIDAIGYLGVALLVALENVFPPIPSEVVLPAAGSWAKDNGGIGPMIVMVAASTVGSVAGAWILYLFAGWIGRERLKTLVERRGKWFGLKPKDIDRAEHWFDEREELAVLVCRCVPLVRSVVSIPAGFSEMPPVRFTVYTAIGSAVWNTALISFGYVAYTHRQTLESVIGYVQYLVLLVIVVAVGWFLWKRAIQPRLSGQPVGVEE